MDIKRVYCPVCNNKTRSAFRKDTTAHNLPVFCPKCKTTSLVNIENGKAEPIVRLVPDARRRASDL